MKKILILSMVFGGLLGGCTSETLDAVIEKTPYEFADGTKGGGLYNTFWDPATGYDQSDVAKLSKFSKSPDFFKCKQCHGWDLEGANASYIGRGPNANRPRVAISLRNFIANGTTQQIFDAIKKTSGRRSLATDVTNYNPSTNFTEGDKMPNYSEILTDSQIWDIVKFFKEDAYKTSDLYDISTSGNYPTGKITYSNIGKNGDATRGKAIFASQGCGSSGCHGANGTAIKVDNATYTVGGFLRAKPNEAQHKIRFGQNENSGMLARKLNLQEMQDLYKALTDTVAFPK